MHSVKSFKRQKNLRKWVSLRRDYLSRQTWWQNSFPSTTNKVAGKPLLQISAVVHFEKMLLFFWNYYGCGEDHRKYPLSTKESESYLWQTIWSAIVKLTLFKCSLQHPTSTDKSENFSSNPRSIRPFEISPNTSLWFSHHLIIKQLKI